MAQSQGQAAMGWVRDAFSGRVLPRCQDAEWAWRMVRRQQVTALG